MSIEVLVSGAGVEPLWRRIPGTNLGVVALNAGLARYV